MESLGGAREAGKDQWEAPGRHQGGRKGLIQGGTREAGGLLKAILCYEMAQAWPAFPRMGFRVIIFIRDKARRL